MRGVAAGVAQARRLLVEVEVEAQVGQHRKTEVQLGSGRAGVKAVAHIAQSSLRNLLFLQHRPCTGVQLAPVACNSGLHG